MSANTLDHPAHAPVAHHFENLEQQNECNALGMWVFLASEVLFFGGLFAAYIAYRSAPGAAFAEASRSLDAVLGAINTAVLLTSSLTMALAVQAAQLGRRQALMRYLVLTLVLGSAFIGIKGYEWHHEYDHGLVPRLNFNSEHWIKEAEEKVLAEHPDWKTLSESDRATLVQGAVQKFVGSVQMFYVFYFIITGIHALHMVIGLIAMVVLLYYAWQGFFARAEEFSLIEVAGLYWHFVDIVWIFVFPVLYLLRQ